MNEGDKATTRAYSGLFIDQTSAVGLEILQSRANIFDAYRNMMDASATFLQKIRDWRILGHGFEQFQTRLTDRQHANAHLLGRDFFSVAGLQSQDIAPDFSRHADFICCDANVMNLHKSRHQTSDIRGHTSDIRTTS